MIGSSPSGSAVGAAVLPALAGSGSHWRASAAEEKLLACRLAGLLGRGNLDAHLKSFLRSDLLC